MGYLTCHIAIQYPFDLFGSQRVAIAFCRDYFYCRGNLGQELATFNEVGGAESLRQDFFHCQHTLRCFDEHFRAAVLV